MTDTRIYLTDEHDHELEIYVDVRDIYGEMVGVYLDCPNAGVEVKLTPDQTRKALAMYYGD